MADLFGGLDAEAYDRSYGDRTLVSRILRYFRPVRGKMLAVAGYALLGALMNLALPIAISGAVGGLAGSRTTGMAGLLVAAILVSGAAAWAVSLGRQWLTARAVADVVLQLRLDVVESVLARDLSFFDEYPSGKIVSRVTSDTQDFSTVVTLSLELVSQIMLVLILGGILFAINVRLALLTLLIGPPIVGVAIAFRILARNMSRRSQRALARVNAAIQESITGMMVAKGFRQEGSMYGEFRQVNDQRYQVNFREGLVYNNIFPVFVTITGLGTAIVIYFGGLRALDHSISAGVWALFVQSIGVFWIPLISIASFWSQFQLGLSASERVFALIDAEPRVHQADSLPVTRLAGRIEFRDLDFQYNEQEQVLRGFNLTIAAGETVALVGHTGAGKSTLGKLVARFYEFQGGSLLIDGRDIRTFDLASYRRHLGVVPQAPFLFSGTVEENIRYARPEASPAEVRAAAAGVGGGDWLAALPSGLETPVGELGRGLSLGQRQLVALARLLLQGPSVVILDEATASVDPLTEAQIQEGLDEVLQHRTAIVIAHRLSTIRTVDRIIVLDHGSIVEEGSHEALLRRGGPYSQLYNTYFRHQSPDYQPGGGFVPVEAAG
ncbi:MAG TPA: ABC transporter ATP-binding protein [Chloroflexota bacterium]|jgi:ABC-type multidrug transport system fused ATPase/permease subunit